MDGAPGPPGGARIDPITCVVVVDGLVPDRLRRELPEFDAIGVARETDWQGTTTMLVGVVSEPSQVHEVLTRIDQAGLAILSASAQPGDRGHSRASP
jgi:hypothetical protein